MGRFFVAASLQALTYAEAIGGTYPFTMGCWFRRNESALAKALMSITTSGSVDQLFRVSANTGSGLPTNIEAVARTTAGSTCATTANWAVNQWHRVDFVCASATSRTIYLDGGNSATSVTSRIPAGMNETFIARIGGTGASYIDGDIALATIWDIALTAGEVLALANGTWPGQIRKANIIGFWPLGIASPEPDYSGFNKAMTLVNAPTISIQGPPRLQLPWGYDQIRTPTSGAVPVKRMLASLGAGK